MVSGTVFTYPDRLDFRSVKVLVVAKLSGKELDRQRVDFGDGGGGGDLTHQQFVKSFPFGKIPGLKTSSGLQVIFTCHLFTMACMQYSRRRAFPPFDYICGTPVTLWFRFC